MKLYQLRENFRMALDTVRSHLMRSLLTLLAVGIGVASVVGVASVLTGLRTGVLGLFQQFGTQNIFVTQFTTLGGPTTSRERQRKPIEPEYAEPLRQQGGHITDVAYQGFGPAPTLKYREQEFTDGSLVGASPNLAETVGLLLESGRFFVDIDNRGRRPVCVLGHSAADALFPGAEQAVGKTLSMSGQKLTVVGIIEKSKNSLFSLGGNDNNVYLPYQTFRKIYPRADFLLMVVRAEEGQITAALDETEGILRRLRGLKSSERNDFELSTYDTFVAFFDTFSRTAMLVIMAFSAVALLVGGIGVMTIMLSTVTERTREIGVRKALGARRLDIVLQFLIEAVTLTVLGGILGVALAAILSLVLRLTLPALPASMPLLAVVVGILGSVITGLIFGVFPAFKAALLDPIECLRYE